jgi:regulator of sigma D
LFALFGQDRVSRQATADAIAVGVVGLHNHDVLGICQKLIDLFEDGHYRVLYGKLVYKAWRPSNARPSVI